MAVHTHSPARRSAAGIALIEVLISILILSVGILGMVGLQVSMTRAQGSAKFRADASYLTSELIGMIWSDIPNIASYTTAPGSVCTYQRCADWVAKVGQGLPAGQAQATATAATGVVTMTVTWSIPNEGTHSYVVETSIK